MTSDQPGPPPTPPNVAALVDAIDTRARQAGSEGATAVLQRMLGSVTDVLGGIQDRLDQLEDTLTSGGAGAGGSAGALTEAVESGLAVFNARLARLEEAFVQAVDESGSGTQAVVDEVRTVVVRALEESRAGGDAATSVDPGTQDALARVEAALSALAGARPSALDLDLDLGPHLAPLFDRLDRIEAAQVRVAGLEERVAEAVASRTDGASSPVDATVLARLEDVVDRLDRDEPSARLVKLVEERMSVGLRAVTERTDEVRRAVDQLMKAATNVPSSSNDDGAIEDVVTQLERLTSEVEALSARLGGRQAIQPATDVGSLVEQIDAAVRREAELLTQRVAALAVGVEASRVLLEQQLHETENSIGRKAGEVTRRLAADFGIRSRRNGPGGRRDPRELGSG